MEKSVKRKKMQGGKIIFFAAAAAVSVHFLPAAEAAADLTVYDSQTENIGKDLGEDEKELPVSFDVRADGHTPRIQSQGGEEICWAQTALSALEGRLLPDQEFHFSVDHMVRENAFTTVPSDGGDYRMIQAYLAGWQGPVPEGETETSDPLAASGMQADQAAVHVQEIRRLKGKSLEEFKKAVYEYGPVQTSLYLTRQAMDSEEGFYNPQTASYYCPQDRKVTHDVLVLGWDDAYSRENFQTVPDRDGAFLCQNSWGENFGKDGIFYVSYADPAMANTGLAYTGIEPADNYDYIYQTDPCGWQDTEGYASDTCYLANVFTAREEEQTLGAVGFYAVGENTSWELYAVENFESRLSFDDRVKISEGKFEDAGYYTVSVDNERVVERLHLAEGQRFAVIVKVTTPGTMAPAAVEVKKDQYTQNVTLEGKEGYLSPDGIIWTSAEDIYGANVCLKAYTLSAQRTK